MRNNCSKYVKPYFRNNVNILNYSNATNRNEHAFQLLFVPLESIILLLSSVVAAGYGGFLNTLLYQRRQNKFSAYSQCVKISGAYTTHLKHPHGLHTEQPRRDMFKLSSVKELSRTTPLPCRLLPMSLKKSSVIDLRDRLTKS